MENGRALRLGGTRQRTLLVALLLHANQPLATDRLIDELWGEDAPETAAKMVQNTVSQLRKLLSHEVLVKRPAGYQLDVDPERVDVSRFERLVEEARDADPATAAAKLREALSLWRGRALADAEETPFVLAARARLEELRAAALEDRIDADLATGSAAELVAELEELVAQQPLRERLRAQLMLALYRSGRQSDALRVYRDTRSVLVDELGVEPSPALQRLQHAILQHDPALEAEPLAVPVAPARELRKTVTVALVEPVSLGAQRDPEVLRVPLADLRDTVASCFEHHGATVEPSTAGALLAVFGVPVVHEDDPVRAARAALEARDAVARDDFALRVGIATGEVVSGGEPALTGEPLDDAAQLVRDAQPGEILLADATRRVLAGAVEVEPVGDAWRLRDIVAGAPLIPRRLDTPFVGREVELAQLRQAFERAVRERTPSLFTVLGAPGIGKSRLVAEFTASLGGDATVLAGRCPPYGDGATLWPLAEMLGQLWLQQPPLATFDREATFRAFRKLFEALARRKPLVLVLEDAHWAEPTLLDLVEHVLDWSADSPILVVCLARPELMETRSGWGGGKPNASAILLASLPERDAQALIEHLARELDVPRETLARVAALAEGNPLFLEQMLAMLRERGPGAEPAVPPTIQALLEARLDLVEPEERAVLERAAVIGREFSEAAVTALSPAGDDVTAHVQALVRRDLIRPQRSLLAEDDGFEFRHALLREAAYASVPKRLRAQLHERIAEWLEHALDARGGEFEEIVGRHLEQAAHYLEELHDEPEHAAELTRQAAGRLATAGRRAYARSDIPAAVTLLSRAAALHEPDVELLVDLGEALREHGELEQAGAVLADAAAVAAGDPVLGAQVRLARLRLELQVDPTIDADQLAAEARRATEVFDALGDDRQLAKAWELAAWVPWFHCHAAEADAAAERAIEHARRAGDGRTEAQSLHLSIGAAYFGPTPVADAVRRCEEILARPTEQPRVQASALRALAGLEALVGDIDHARELCAKHRELVEDLGLRVTAASASETYGFVEQLAGDAAAAEAEFRRGYDELEELGEKFLSAILAALLAHTLSAQGRNEDALRFSELSERAAGADDLLAQVQWRTARAVALARTKRAEEGEAFAREAVERVATTDFLVVRGDALLDLAEVLRAAGRTDPAVPLVTDAVQVYERKGATVPATRARIVLDGLVQAV